MDNILKKIQNGTDSFKELLIIYLVSATIVAFLFMFFEHRNLVDSYWWTFVTGLTIGYGDIYPQTVAGQILTILWASFMVIFLIPMFVLRVILKVNENRNEFTDEEQKEILKFVRENTAKGKK